MLVIFYYQIFLRYKVVKMTSECPLNFNSQKCPVYTKHLSQLFLCKTIRFQDIAYHNSQLKTMVNGKKAEQNFFKNSNSIFSLRLTGLVQTLLRNFLGVNRMCTFNRDVIWNVYCNMVP